MTGFVCWFLIVLRSWRCCGSWSWWFAGWSVFFTLFLVWARCRNLILRIIICGLLRRFLVFSIVVSWLRLGCGIIRSFMFSSTCVSFGVWSSFILVIISWRFCLVSSVCVLVFVCWTFFITGCVFCRLSWVFFRICSIWFFFIMFWRFCSMNFFFVVSCGRCCWIIII